MKKVLLTTGNDPQVDFAIKSRRTFLDHNIIDEFILISDNLSDASAAKLNNSGWSVYLIKSQDIKQNYQSNIHPLGKIAKPCFVDTFLASRPDLINIGTMIIFSDTDIACQRKLDELINHNVLQSMKVVFSGQYDTFSNFTPPWGRIARALNDGLIGLDKMFVVDCEVNTGFFFGNGISVKKVVSYWSNEMLNPQVKRFMHSSIDGKRDAWHDQDYFRYLLRGSERFRQNIDILNSQEIIHLSGRGWRSTRVRVNVIKTITTLSLQYIHQDRRTKKIPYIVHFAGRTYKNRLIDSLYWEGLIETIIRSAVSLKYFINTKAKSAYCLIKSL